MSLRKSVFTVGGLTLVSRVTGFARDILVAASLGAGALTDVFFVAFKLPNFFRRLFGEGAFNAAFVPMFSAKLESQGREKARLFAENIFAVMFFILLGFTAIVEIFMPLVMIFLAPGFVSNPEQFDLTVQVTRISFPYVIFICLVAFMSGVLNSLGRFAAAASAPIILNACLISALLFFGKKFATPVHSLVWGISCAGVIQFFWLYFACKKAGLPLALKKPRINSDVKKLFKLMVPGIIGAGIVQINLWIDIIIGTLIPGAISYLYYADRISQLPLGVVGVAVGTALLPLLSKHVEKGDKKEAVDTINKALSLAMFLVIPAAVGAVVMAHPIISVLFERGEFDSKDAIATAYALMAYAFGLPAFVMVKVFTPGFFAAHDTKTPVKIAIACLFLNIILCFSFIFLFRSIGFYQHVGIALATGVAAWINIFVLARILARDGRFAPDRETKIKIAKTIFSSLVMAVVLKTMLSFFPGLTSAGEIGRITIFIIVFAVGVAAFFGTAIITKTISIAELKGLKRKKR